MVVNVEFRKAHDHTPAVERSHMIVGPKVVGCSSAFQCELDSLRSISAASILASTPAICALQLPELPMLGETEGYECAACIACMPACNPGGTQIARVTVKMNQSASTRVIMRVSPHHPSA